MLANRYRRPNELWLYRAFKVERTMSAKDGDFHRKQRNMSDAYFKTIRAKNFCPLAQTNECGIPEGSLSISACPENFLSTAGSSVTNADMTALRFQCVGVVGSSVNAPAFAAFQCCGRHRPCHQHHVLKFPASRIDKISTTNIIRPKIELLPSGHKILFIPTDPHMRHIRLRSELRISVRSKGSSTRIFDVSDGDSKRGAVKLSG